MSEKAFYISTLIQKKLKAEISAEEEIELKEWLHQPENKKVFEELSDENWIKQELEKFDGYDAEKIKDKVKMKVEEENENKVHPLYPNHQRFNWRRVVAAAAVIIFVAIGSYFAFFRHAENLTIAKNPAAPVQNDVLPGGNKATLTLADGSVIILDSSANGALAQQGNTKIIKLDSGMLAYNTISGNTSEILYNTITTPRGGQYQIQLPDGSKVWLNAASSLRFPTAFNGDERNVTLTGEGYFEVAHNPLKPFHVLTGTTQVEVLGTHFNIMAYGDEDLIKTTLLEGSVKVTSPSKAVMLQPGQQANVAKSGSVSVVLHANMEEAVGWKDGLFKLNKTDIQEIMRQIVRWYDVEVVYEGAIPSGTISGDISRNMNLSKVLKVLELSGVHCRIENKKVYVAP